MFHASTNIFRPLKLQGKSDKTIDAYAHALRPLSAWFHCCPDRLEREQLAEYFSELVESCSWPTVKMNRCGMHFFYRPAQRELAGAPIAALRHLERQQAFLRHRALHSTRLQALITTLIGNRTTRNDRFCGLRDIRVGSVAKKAAGTGAGGNPAIFTILPTAAPLGPFPPLKCMQKMLALQASPYIQQEVYLYELNNYRPQYRFRG